MTRLLVDTAVLGHVEPLAAQAIGAGAPERAPKALTERSAIGLQPGEAT